MCIIFKKIIFLFLISFSSLLYSQQKTKEVTKNIVTEKLYAYRFKGELPKHISENLTKDISKMLFVSGVKVEYKTEKQSGQVRVWTKEYFINIDTEFQFNILALNELLVKYNLTPVEYTADLLSK